MEKNAVIAVFPKDEQAYKAFMDLKENERIISAGPVLHLTLWERKYQTNSWLVMAWTITTTTATCHMLRCYH
ncbi:hypothetical protein H7R52_02190 [Weissella confusa]|uniref:Uncharacterized protein n=1 Tax=Weissella confusa TaxID=1583 RepID=A0A923NGB6_WEICO|nr:hypothetical protein [Weissella confusa]